MAASTVQIQKRDIFRLTDRIARSRTSALRAMVEPLEDETQRLGRQWCTHVKSPHLARLRQSAVE